MSVCLSSFSQPMSRFIFPCHEPCVWVVVNGDIWSSLTTSHVYNSLWNMLPEVWNDVSDIWQPNPALPYWFPITPNKRWYIEYRWSRISVVFRVRIGCNWWKDQLARPMTGKLAPGCSYFRRYTLSYRSWFEHIISYHFWYLIYPGMRIAFAQQHIMRLNSSEWLMGVCTNAGCR